MKLHPSFFQTHIETHNISPSGFWRLNLLLIWKSSKIRSLKFRFVICCPTNSKSFPKTRLWTKSFKVQICHWLSHQIQMKLHPSFFQTYIEKYNISPSGFWWLNLLLIWKSSKITSLKFRFVICCPTNSKSLTSPEPSLLKFRFVIARPTNSKSICKIRLLPKLQAQIFFNFLPWGLKYGVEPNL